MRIAGEHVQESIQDIETLLAQGGQVAPNATEVFHPVLRTEAARDLLLKFHHAQIPFGLIVVKGKGEIIHKAEY